MAITTVHPTIAHLNKFQLEPAQHINGPLFVLAGPGSGKTNLIVSRASYMIEKGIDPLSMLMFTFTKKAANEMRERVHLKVGPRANDLTVSTYHSFCSRLLRKYANYLGYETNFTIYDTDDQISTIKKIAKDGMFKPRDVINEISSMKNKNITPQKALEKAQYEGTAKDKYVAEVYKQYQKELKEQNAVDFDDLILLSILLLRTQPEVKREVNQRYRYLFCDETQDSSSRDLDLIKLLAGDDMNVCLIADDDQSIYAFRGADINEILKLKARFKGLKVYTLQQNYRSTQTIVNAARSLISHNEQSYEKELFTENKVGEQLMFIDTQNQSQEASYISTLIEALTQNGTYQYKDIAILYRMNHLSRSIEEALLQKQVPYTVVGGLPFYKRREIKDIMSYIRLAYNPLDREAFERAIGVPKRGVGDKSLEHIHAYVRNRASNYIDALPNTDLRGKAKKGVEQFYTFMEKFREELYTMAPKDIVLYVVHGIKYIDLLVEMDEPDMETRVGNLDELVNIAASYDQVDEFLENLSLNVEDAEQIENSINLMTLHASKGLEFPIIIMIGNNEGIIPSWRADTQASIEEERRLHYVGMTRAKEILILTRPKMVMNQGRSQYQEESRFIGEIDPQYIRGRS
ncbi:ATP-dependent helicase [Kurthia sp. Dielmo]|uniref:ATP-dependent helicase n=1 Tax=Kurthia sp. Dielmo TaxID=1033738 RepID=UPI00111FC9A4|nr:UvrD-helicase domain-containing protein [Kurthia sp. Dielmo]